MTFKFGGETMKKLVFGVLLILISIMPLQVLAEEETATPTIFRLAFVSGMDGKYQYLCNKRRWE